MAERVSNDMTGKANLILIRSSFRDKSEINVTSVSKAQ